MSSPCQREDDSLQHHQPHQQSLDSDTVNEPLEAGATTEALHLAGAKRESNQDLIKAPLRNTNTSNDTDPSSTDALLPTQQQPAHASSEAASSSLPPSSSGKANAFAQLVQGWEAYMNDPIGETFPLQLLCGAASHAHFDRIAPGGALGPSAVEGHLLAPAALRHTHSSPLKYGTHWLSTLHEPYYNSTSSGEAAGASSSPSGGGGADRVPPPIPLDPFQRSSSTPSSFRQRSTNSAFTDRIPSQRVSYTSIGGKPDALRAASAFDPVSYYARALEDMERTSIEVTDTSPPTKHREANEESQGEGQGPDNHPGSEPIVRIGAATRAARFLSDVRVLRRRRRGVRGGRDNPARPPSNSSSSRDAATDSKNDGDDEGYDDENDKESRGLDTAVTVITEPNAPETSLLSQSSELSALLQPFDESDGTSPLPKSNSATSTSDQEHDDSKSTVRSGSDPYHKLDSDVDEEEIHFRSIYQHPESPGTIPSPSYVPILDESVLITDKPIKTRIRIRIPEGKEVDGCAASTPSPTRMGREGSTTPRSSDSANISPGTRSSATGSSSGHTTQATFSTMSSNPQSGLSTISETDREVMQANQEGKRRRRRGLDSLRTLDKTEEEIGPEGTEGVSLITGSSTSSNPNGYVSLGNSPVPLRDGANLQPYRLFTNSPNSGASASGTSPTHRPAVPLRRSGHSGSPGTVETSSATHTSSSVSNSEEIPPKFVSYLDRQGASDLTSVREAVEVSTKRGDTDKSEEREDSPAEFDKYPELIFADADLIRSSSSPLPRPSSAKGRLCQDRYRSRPPRTPTKGLLPRTTPPPRGAVSPLNHPSPPRDVVDQPSIMTDSRPSVLRTIADGLQSAAAMMMLVDESLVDSASPPVAAPMFGLGGYVSPINFKDDDISSQKGSVVRGRTYEDGSVEILKSASAGSASPPTLVTPEKNV